MLLRFREKNMVGNACSLGTRSRRASNGGAAREGVFVCPTGVGYLIKSQIGVGLQGSVIGICGSALVQLWKGSFCA
jgi:hypothetical protein